MEIKGFVQAAVCSAILILNALVAVAQPEPPASKQPPTESLLNTDSSTAKVPNATSGDSSIPSHAVLVALQQARLSSQFAGEISLISALPGDSFKKGQVLIQFKCEEQIAGYRKAVAEMNAAKAAWAAAGQLDKLQSISKVEVAKAKATYEKASAEAAHQGALLSKCQVKAPYDGQVSELLVKAHETVKPGDALMEIVNNNSLYVQVFVPSTWLKWIKNGTPFQVTLNEYPETIDATVVKIGAKIDTSSRTVQLYGRLSQSYSGLVNGMSGVAHFKGHPK